MEQARHEVVRRLGRVLAEKGWLLALAESCTGGLASSRVTDLAGSSAWYAGGLVAYSNTIKRNVLGVAQDVLDTKGAVSREAVLAMARGALGVFGADVAVAISGIAGPEGGSPQKPVGTVWMAWQGPFGVEVKRYQFAGDRLAVKDQAASAALAGLLDLATREAPPA